MLGAAKHLRHGIGSGLFARHGVGTFQITHLPLVDNVAPPMFAAPAILGVGGVRERVVAVDGRPEVRPTAILTCSADHKVYDGRGGTANEATLPVAQAHNGENSFNGTAENSHTGSAPRGSQFLILHNPAPRAKSPPTHPTGESPS